MAIVFWVSIVGGSALVWGAQGAGYALLGLAGFTIFCAMFDI